MSVLTSADLPKPDKIEAFMDNNREIWLFEPDPPSVTGKWRIPGGTIAKPGNRVLDIALERRGVTSLRKMLPVRR